VASQLLMGESMKIRAAIAFSLLITGCVSDQPEEEFEFGQSIPTNMGKADGPQACGAGSCLPELCGYNASVAGEQAKEECADHDGRPDSFVTGSVSGSTFDSRTNPYAPVFSLDKVLVYGCELWDFSSGAYDGLEIQYEELIHSSFVVDENDPTRKARHFDMYIGHFAGPGSYRAEASYQASSESPRAAQADACTVDVAVDGSGTVSGTYSCALGSTSVSGSFGCAKNAMSPIFSRWAAAPQ
jgi:hypothetical protein